MSSILIAGLTLGIMGLVFGIVLAFASQKFAVEVDERAVAIREAVPGANCGGCGFPGCDGFANAVVAGKAPVNGCPVGGPDCASKIAEIMGVTAGEGARQVANVLCNGGDHCTNSYDYEGIEDCRAAHMLHGGGKSCTYGCLGLGTCVTACPFDAIHMSETNVALVEKEKCVACGKCIAICPKQIIQYVPYDQFTIVECMNKERGAHVKKSCGVACIACGICEKNCPVDAIHVIDLVARIDYDKCTNCQICAQKCPTKAIRVEAGAPVIEVAAPVIEAAE